MRNTREDAWEHRNGMVAGAPVDATTGTRRAVLGVTAGGLALATRGLLLPEWLAEEADAAEHPVRSGPQRANKRRHRRRHRHPHNHELRALAALALSRSQEIPGDIRTPIRFDMVLARQDLSLIDTYQIVILYGGLYTLELFLTWRSSDTGAAETGVLVNDSLNDNHSTIIGLEPTVASNSTILDLHVDDTLQVVVQTRSATPAPVQAQVSAGAMVLQLLP